MPSIGQSYKLEVVKQVEFGYFLDADNLGLILLPNRNAPKGLKVEDWVQVFLYLDSEDRPVATTQMPKAEVGQFAYLPVVETTKFGAFLDWGLDKHLLVPFAEQHRPMQQGHSYLVYLYIDARDERIVASSKIDKFIDDDAAHPFRAGDAVNLIIANSTDLGFKAIVEHSHWGLLFKEDVFQRLSFGQSVRGFVQRVREDGRINLTLNGGRKSNDDNCDTLIHYLQKHDGFAPLHDKSDPQEIKQALAISKGAFKQAVGRLLKSGALTLEDGGIALVDASKKP